MKKNIEVKEQTYSIVGTNKETRIRKSFESGMSKNTAEIKLPEYTGDRYFKKFYRYIKIARDTYHQRMEGSLGEKMSP